jgi:uncharacterized protein YukJ
MARLYSNENFPLPVVEKLRELGHDVLTIQESGKADQALPDKLADANQLHSRPEAVTPGRGSGIVTLHHRADAWGDLAAAAFRLAGASDGGGVVTAA